jgi:hypothetical protein
LLVSPFPVASGPRPFRPRDAADVESVPGQTGLFGRLNREWAGLVSLPSVSSTLRRWSRTEPELLGITSLSGLLDRVDASRGTAEDELLLALIRLTHSGQQLAGRVVLQAMLPKLVRLTAGFRGAGAGVSAEEQRHAAVAVFWEVLHAYPVERRRSSVAGNLALDTLHELTRHQRMPPDEIPIGPDELDHRLSAGARHQAWDHAHERAVRAELLEVIAWGQRVAAITPDEAALLLRVYLPGTLSCRRADVAAELGLSEPALRQRCSRAGRRLAEAVRATAGDTSAAVAPAVPA